MENQLEYILNECRFHPIHFYEDFLIHNDLYNHQVNSKVTDINKRLKLSFDNLIIQNSLMYTLQNSFSKQYGHFTAHTKMLFYPSNILLKFISQRDKELYELDFQNVVANLILEGIYYIEKDLGDGSFTQGEYLFNKTLLQYLRKNISSYSDKLPILASLVEPNYANNFVFNHDIMGVRKRETNRNKNYIYYGKQELVVFKCFLLIKSFLPLKDFTLLDEKNDNTETVPLEKLKYQLQTLSLLMDSRILSDSSIKETLIKNSIISLKHIKEIEMGTKPSLGDSVFRDCPRTFILKSFDEQRKLITRKTP
jgi:hypothetical protein